MCGDLWKQMFCMVCYVFGGDIACILGIRTWHMSLAAIFEPLFTHLRLLPACLNIWVCDSNWGRLWNPLRLWKWTQPNVLHFLSQGLIKSAILHYSYVLCIYTYIILKYFLKMLFWILWRLYDTAFKRQSLLVLPPGVQEKY